MNAFTPDEDAVIERIAKSLVTAIKTQGETLIAEDASHEKLNPELVLASLMIVMDEFIDMFSATEHTKVVFWQDIERVAAIKSKYIADADEALREGDQSEEETVH